MPSCVAVQDGRQSCGRCLVRLHERNVGRLTEK